MSFSFTVRAATKVEAVELVSAELDKVVASQPIHEADRKLVQDTADAYIELIRDDETQDIVLTVNGSCYGNDDGFNGAAVGVNASLQAKPVPVEEPEAA